MGQMAQEEAESIHASRVDAFLSKVVKKALSDALLAGSNAIKDEFRASLYQLVMYILKKMAATGGPEEIFDHDKERWAQDFPFMDAFVQSALTSPRLVRPVIKFIKLIVTETTQAIEPNRKLVDLPIFFPASASSSYISSI